MKVFVVIVTYNGIEWIKKCITSVINSSTVCKIIVVDNNSKDETVEFIKSNFQSVTLLCQKENLGFGRANNIGIKYALANGADYLILMNQDVYIEKNTIDELITIHKENPEFGILSPLHLNGNKSKLDENFINYIVENKNLISDFVSDKNPQKIYNLSFINAAFWFLPARIFKIVGGFDPMFFHYAEDNNYCQRVLFHGFKIGVVPEFSIIHDRAHGHSINVPRSYQDYLLVKERFYKVECGNVNKNALAEINKYQSELKIKYLTSLLIGEFSSLRRIKGEINLLKKIKQPIIVSHKQNKEKGNLYLS